MRSGVHRASFEFRSGRPARPWVGVQLGIVRPMNYKLIYWSGNRYGDYPTSKQVTEKYPSPWRDEVNINAVLLSQYGGVDLCKGLEETYTPQNVRLQFDVNDRIGLVLNLDAGTLSMHKNGIYVGELCSGLEGEYLWVGCIVGVPQCTNISISDWE